MRITFNCEYCNKETNQIPSVYNRSEHHYCSRECKQKARGYKIEVKCDYCVSKVTFKKLSSEQIYEYIATKEPMDKAGSYAIQGIGSKLIESYEGDFDNIVGLPMRLVLEFLKK